jgi:membrane associated rhomboid family serine protease
MRRYHDFPSERPAMPLFFIPIGDDKDKKTIIPFVKYALIAMNFVVFFILQSGEKGERFTMAYALVPKEIVTGEDEVVPSTSVLDPETDLYYEVPGLAETPIPVWLTLLTSIFMHGSLSHLIGNMVYLQIFGTAVEDEMGHEKFLIFYLFMGVAAGFAHVFMNASGEDALVPCLGASGAIAGVLGAYFVHHPLRNVHLLVLRTVISLPAWAFLGIWLLLQIYGGLQPAAEGGGGVAFAAHIGGFLFGAVLGLAFSNPKPAPEYMTVDKLAKMQEEMYQYEDTEGVRDYSEWKDREWR